MTRPGCLAGALLILNVLKGFGQDLPVGGKFQDFNIHVQVTVIPQFHPAFNAEYSGQNSFRPSEPPEFSLTATLFAGARLWRGAELYINPELAGGRGLSNVTGIAGFPNGETFRIGNPVPQMTVARLYLRQTIALSDRETATTDQPNQLAGFQPVDRLTVFIGRISMTDFFDNNAYSHDPRTQFFNWALMTNGAWDYPADTRGYTWGIVAELALPPWAVRLSSAMVPTEANKSTMDRNLDRARSETIEIERSYASGSQKGVVRLLGYYTRARMGSYTEALRMPPGQVDIVSTREYGRKKYGVGLNVEHAFSDNFGVMLRAGWNDGTNETWMFTEIDRTISSAIVVDGALWQRNGDNAGFAVLLNGIAPDHRDYLNAGGSGFIIGDGKLRYEAEIITELYYSYSVPQASLSFSPDYQFVLHPAYNADRGPVHVFGLRAHLAL